MKNLIIVLAAFAAVCVLCVIAKNQEHPVKSKADGMMLNAYREYFKIADSLIWSNRDIDTYPLFDSYITIRSHVIDLEYKIAGKW